MKNNMKKFLSIIISLLILANCFYIGAFASDSSPVTDVSDAVAKVTVVLNKDSITKDDVLTVSIRVDANYHVTGVQLPVLYDKTQFEIVTGSGVGGYLDFNEDSEFLNGSYALNGNTTHSTGFKYTSNAEKWNTDEARAQYSYAWITASANTSVTDFRLVVPENDLLVSFKLKALADVEDTTQSVFISTEWAKTADVKSGIFTLGFSGTQINKNPLTYVASGMTYETETMVFFPAEKIELDCTYATLTKENPTIQLNATITPENATDKSVKWESDDETVAKVDENGLVTRVGEGGATITATDSAGNTATCDIFIPHQCEKVTMTYHEEIPADCYNSGEKAYYECYCGSYFTDEDATDEIVYADIYIKPLAHPDEYVQKTDAVEATHTSEGNIEYRTCSLCGDSFSDENCTVKVTDVTIPATGHEDASAIEWTQNETHHEKICSCGEILQSQEHTFKWVTDSEASCQVPGIRHEECTVCGYKRNENTEITVLHETEKYDEVAPDCTENGNIEYYLCVNCGSCFTDEECENKILIEDTVIPATGHSYSDWVTDTSASCEEDGQKHKTCSVCGDIVTETIDKTGHNYIPEVTPPTPTAEGFTTYTCEYCADTYKSDFVDMLDEFSFGGTVNSTGDESEVITVVLTSKGAYQVEYTTEITGNTASFAFDAVAEGEYTLTISKKNHATLTCNIVIDSEGITTAATLHLIGDIDGNGKITVADYSRALRHVKKLVLLEGYAFSCADVNEDGKITVADYSIMIRHIKKIDTIW